MGQLESRRRRGARSGQDESSEHIHARDSEHENACRRRHAASTGATRAASRTVATDSLVFVSELTGDINLLARHYSRFRVGERLLLTGHSHQAWPDIAFDAQQRAWLAGAALLVSK